MLLTPHCYNLCMVLSRPPWRPRLASVLAPALLASLLPAVTSPQDDLAPAHEFLLEYREELAGPNLWPPEVHWDADRTPLPELGGLEVRRGALRIGESRVVRLAWDGAQRTLYVDRNQNGDLSDDEPIERVERRDRGPVYEHIELHAPEGPEHGMWKVLLPVERPGTSTPDGIAVVTSGWTGTVELGGMKYRFDAFDNLDGVFTPGTDQLELRAETNAAGVRIGDADALPESVLLGTRLYDLSLSLDAGEDGGTVRATFTESSIPLFDCELLGTHLASLKLEPTGEVAPSMMILLVRPSGRLRLPEGEYQARIEIDGGELGWLRSRGGVVVHAEGESVLRAGCPLDNSIDYRRSGAATLEIEYQLRGQGGEKYELQPSCVPDRRFVVCVGDREVGSADFRYG